MAGSATNFAENKIAAYLFGAVSLSLPATYYIAAFTVPPGEAGGGTEVSGGSYARVAVTNNNTEWATTLSQVVNINEIAFPTSSANWGSVSAIAIMDASSGGNMWFYTTITPTLINSGDTLKITAGSLAVTVA